VLQAAWTQLLAGLTGQRDLAFGAVVAGRPDDLSGAESMVGLLVNTVPVRARITPATTTSDLIAQLQQHRARTLDHEHLGLNEIHHLTGHRRLFDTVVVYENYPVDAAALAGADGLTLSDLAARDHYHYPLALQVVPGDELDLRLQYRLDVFDAATADALLAQLRWVLVAMTTAGAEPITIAGEAEFAPWTAPAESPAPAAHRPPVALTEQVLADIYAQVLGVDGTGVGVDQSFFDLGGDSVSALRAIVAINTAFGHRLPVTALFDTPTVAGMSRRFGAPSDAENPYHR
jgi:non-ribosomal peptide synthetase component F